MEIETKIKKWGNSLALRLPKEIARKFRLFEDSKVSVFSDSKIISIRLSRPTTKKLILDELLAKINPKNKHEELKWSSPQGKEIW